MLDTIKTLLNIEGNEEDAILDILIEDTTSQLLLIIDEEELPNKFNFIVREVVVKRYNRLGSEGYSSESVSEHQVTFSKNDNLFEDYKYILEEYKGRGRRGRLTLI